MNNEPDHQVDLCVTNRETGRDHYIKTGSHLTLHAEAMAMVSKGKDAWTRPSNPAAVLNPT